MSELRHQFPLIEESRRLTNSRKYREVVELLSPLPIEVLNTSLELGRDLAEAYLFLHQPKAGLKLTAALLNNNDSYPHRATAGQLRIMRAAFLGREGFFAEAESLYTEVLEEVGWLEVSPLVAEAHNGLAIISGLRGEWEIAIPQLQRALVLYQQLGNRRGVASVFHNLGLSHRYLDACEEAERNFRHAYSYYFVEGTDEEKVFVEAERSLAILGMGDSAMAEVMANRALARCREIGAEEMCGDCLRIAGSIARAQGRCSESREYLFEGYRYARKYRNLLLKAEIHEEVALSMLQLGKNLSAIKHRTKAHNLYQTAGSSGHSRRLDGRFARISEPIPI